MESFFFCFCSSSHLSVVCPLRLLLLLLPTPPPPQPQPQPPSNTTYDHNRNRKAQTTNRFCFTHTHSAASSALPFHFYPALPRIRWDSLRGPTFPFHKQHSRQPITIPHPSIHYHCHTSSPTRHLYNTITPSTSPSTFSKHLLHILCLATAFHQHYSSSTFEILDLFRTKHNTPFTKSSSTVANLPSNSIALIRTSVDNT